jgi:hypothetical protein
MINHLRTLLLNMDPDPSILAHPHAEIVPSGFSETRLPGPNSAAREMLLGSGDRLSKEFMATLLSSVATAFDVPSSLISAIDPRLTYDPVKIFEGYPPSGPFVEKTTPWTNHGARKSPERGPLSCWDVFAIKSPGYPERALSGVLSALSSGRMPDDDLFEAFPDPCGYGTGGGTNSTDRPDAGTIEVVRATTGTREEVAAVSDSGGEAVYEVPGGFSFLERKVVCGVYSHFISIVDARLAPDVDLGGLASKLISSDQAKALVFGRTAVAGTEALFEENRDRYSSARGVLEKMACVLAAYAATVKA